MNIVFEGKSKEILDEFLKISRDLIGVYFDAVIGFDRNRLRLEEDQKKMLEKINKNDPNYSLKQLDNSVYAYGEGDPNISMPEIFFYSTQKEYKLRNSKDGKNYQFIGNMCLMIIYQYWEDYYRGKLAKSYEIDKDDIQSDLFGDLRLIRHSIIHHNSIASSEIKRCKKQMENIFNQKERLDDKWREQMYYSNDVWQVAQD